MSMMMVDNTLCCSFLMVCWRPPQAVMLMLMMILMPAALFSLTTYPHRRRPSAARLPGPAVDTTWSIFHSQTWAQSWEMSLPVWRTDSWQKVWPVSCTVLHYLCTVQ